MSSGAPSPFLVYLACELPFGYPYDPPITAQFLTVIKERNRKEITLQQAEFLETATSMAATHPWIAYLGALKHEALLSLIPLNAPQFVNVIDQKVFNDCQEQWRKLGREMKPAIEDGLAFFCERLINLQRDAGKLDDLQIKLQAALDAGFTSLSSLPNQPPTGKVTGLAALGKAKQEEAEAELKRWHHQDSYLQASQKTLNKIMCVPPEMRRSGLSDVAGTLQALKDIREERELLVSTYITPYFAA